ncbi:WhiB family transcriptional regulator [Desertihabitans brevis]|uniref:Transcriptional regulator WhiB n=1 Tax=Desertihabitans brevis TaxID=2268447 RepID=A0A367YZ25_9ACTN|nr:WhiB family transcriptional regulator [Desertihabitans brevis]RCK70957.1 WhiB family transcriptional regulator [Desertihabitans brevis]
MTATLYEIPGLLGASLPATGQRLPCHEVEPDTFFAESPAEVEHAKALCVGCPLQAECLAGALDRKEPWGVWGGQLVIAGVVVPRKRPRGRPRKHPRPDEVAATTAPAPAKKDQRAA